MSVATPPDEILAPPLPTSLGLEHAGLLLTPEQFDAIEEADELYRYELIRGVLVVCPPPAEGARSPNEWLGYLLTKYQIEHPDGSALDATLAENYIRTGESRRDRRIADRVVWCGLGRRPKLRGGDPPAIAVEFVSEGSGDRRRDYVDKLAEYPAAGVREYWIIDRFARRMTVVTPDAGPRVVAENEVYTTPLLPGFELPLAQVLAVADRWTD